MVELAAVMDSGQKRLHELGNYKQELKRTLSAISSFALCLSVLSILLGVTALYNTGLTYGGTISFTWGWFICGFFNLLIGLAMAEVQCRWAVGEHLQRQLRPLSDVGSHGVAWDRRSKRWWLCDEQVVPVNAGLALCARGLYYDTYRLCPVVAVFGELWWPSKP